MTRSGDLFREAQGLIPGGVSSPARAFAAVGGDPLYAVRGEGAYLYDADGDAYVDYVQGFGSIILGHADARVADAVVDAARRGAAFGVNTPDEVRLASLIAKAVPSVERVRFVTSGTEAAMTAVRLARAATRRRVVVKFEGCYHGHADAFLARAGSGVATFGIPSAEGVPEASVVDTLILPFNDAETFERALEVAGDEMAAVLLEPVPANMGVVLPAPDFLLRVVRGARASGALVVFDEVVTGFRLGPAGAQGAFGLEPDLTMLGKVIGGGFPIGAVGGRAEVMEMLAPSGPVYQAGTFAAHPHAMAAGAAVLEALSGDAFAVLEQSARTLAEGLEDAAREAGAEACVVRAGTILSVFFRATAPSSFEETQESDRDAFARFHRALRARAVLIAPSQFEAWFPSLAHSQAPIERTLDAARPGFRAAAAA